MKGEKSKTRKQNGGPGFRISGGPVVRGRKPAAAPAESAQLPRNYGTPILFAIPRDPQTIFTYWNIDWSDALSRNSPVDRQVYLRLKRDNGTDETEEPIEPMLGTHFLLVSQPKGTYQVELGFYHPANVWNSVATSDSVTMPADSSSENSEIDLATVPVHLSFQRMIDLFRANNGGPITSLLSDLQERAVTGSDGGLTDEEHEILRAMELSLADLEAARRSFGGRSVNETLRKRAEALLGFGGGTSPAGGPGGQGGLGGSSWSSGVS